MSINNLCTYNGCVADPARAETTRPAPQKYTREQGKQENICIIEYKKHSIIIFV